MGDSNTQGGSPKVEVQHAEQDALRTDTTTGQQCMDFGTQGDAGMGVGTAEACSLGRSACSPREVVVHEMSSQSRRAPSSQVSQEAQPYEAIDTLDMTVKVSIAQSIDKGKKGPTFSIRCSIGGFLENQLTFSTPKHHTPPFELPLDTPIPQHFDGVRHLEHAYERHLEHPRTDPDLDPCHRRQGK